MIRISRSCVKGTKCRFQISWVFPKFEEIWNRYPLTSDFIPGDSTPSTPWPLTLSPRAVPQISGIARRRGSLPVNPSSPFSQWLYPYYTAQEAFLTAISAFWSYSHWMTGQYQYSFSNVLQAEPVTIPSTFLVSYNVVRNCSLIAALQQQYAM